MLAHGLEPRLVVPALVEGLEYMDELRLAEPVEMRDHGIELGDHVLPLIFRQRAVGHAHGLGPSRKAPVGRGETTGERDNALPSGIFAIGSRDRKWVQDEKVNTYLD